MGEKVQVSRFSSYTQEDAAQLGVLSKIASPDRSGEPIAIELLQEMIYYPRVRVLYVARNQAKHIVGSAVINKVASPDLGAETEGCEGKMDFVATLPDYQGQGVFKQLWQKGLVWCSEHGISALDCPVPVSSDAYDEAALFYERYGARVRNVSYFRVAFQEALAQFE